MQSVGPGEEPLVPSAARGMATRQQTSPKKCSESRFLGKWYAEFMINIFCTKAWSLMSTMVSCRGSLKPKEPCPVGISDIVLLHNHVVQALAVTKNPPDIWELCPASLKTQFLKYFKLFAKRLETMDPQCRILPVDEAISTTVSVPGFVFEFNRRKVMAEQKTEDFKLVLQFLHHHRDNYLKQCAEFSEC